MQFGVCLPHRWKYASARLIADVAQEAESLRFDSVWVTGHVIVPVTYVERGHILYEALIKLAFEDRGDGHDRPGGANPEPDGPAREDLLLWQMRLFAREIMPAFRPGPLFPRIAATRNRRHSDLP